MLAAILFCGASVFTACSDDDDNSPAKEQTGTEKAKFVEHTRTVTKDLAENLNFTSWVTANTYSQYFNDYVLNNSDFQDAVLVAFATEVLKTVTSVEEGSELANQGYKTCATVDLTNFKYRFTMNDDNKSFDVTEAENFEIILNGTNPKTKELEKGMYKVTMKVDGTKMTRYLPMPKVEETVMEIVLGSKFQFALSSKTGTDTWNEDFSGIMHYLPAAGEADASKGYTADAIIKSNILAGTVGDKADNTQLELSITSDRVKGVATGKACWTQNSRKMFEVSVTEKGDNLGALGSLDLSKFESSASIFDVIGSILATRSIEEAKVTLLDDLTTTFSISDLQKLLEIENEYRTDGRNYADKQTIEEYTKKMNELVKAKMYCKATNQTIPMCLLTDQVGVDYWAVYGLKFSDEAEYVSLLSLLDRKTFAYMLNIMDHSVDHMQQSVIVGRQLIQFVLDFNKQFADSDSSQEAN